MQVEAALCIFEIEDFGWIGKVVATQVELQGLESVKLQQTVVELRKIRSGSQSFWTEELVAGAGFEPATFRL